MARTRIKRTVAKSAAEIPGRQLACRVHHQWPSEDIVDGRKLPLGVWIDLYDAQTDMWHLNDQCPRCGCVRYQDMPGRRYVNGPWKRKYDKDWVVYKEKFTSRDALRENIGRNLSKLLPAGLS